MKMRRIGSRLGLTLVEVMIAAFIMVIGFIGVLGLVRVLSYQLTSAARMTVATEKAQSKLDELMAGSFPPAAGSQTEGLYTTSWTVSSTTNSDLRTVNLRVIYHDPSGRSQTNVTLTTLVRDPTIPPLDVPFASFPTNALQYE